MKANENGFFSLYFLKDPELKTVVFEVKAQKIKIVNQLKQDTQEFGLLFGEKISPEKMHSNPPTSIPLTLINPSEKL